MSACRRSCYCHFDQERFCTYFERPPSHPALYMFEGPIQLTLVRLDATPQLSSNKVVHLSGGWAGVITQVCASLKCM